MSDSSYGSVYVEGVTYIDEREIAKRDAEIERLREGERAADAEIERLRQENECLGAAMSSDGADACAALVVANAEIERLRDILLRAGFVQCDIPACNCGSWHHRYGLPERWEEIKQIVEEAGHPLTNANGHILRKAVQELISAKDAEIGRLREQVAVWLECYKTEKQKREDLEKRIREALGE